MPGRLSNLLQGRGRSRPPRTSRRRLGRGECLACGSAIVAHDHAIQLTSGVFHAGCVLYRPREAPVPPAPTF